MCGFHGNGICHHSYHATAHTFPTRTDWKRKGGEFWRDESDFSESAANVAPIVGYGRPLSTAHNAHFFFKKSLRFHFLSFSIFITRFLYLSESTKLFRRRRIYFICLHHSTGQKPSYRMGIHKKILHLKMP